MSRTFPFKRPRTQRTKAQLLPIPRVSPMNSGFRRTCRSRRCAWAHRTDIAPPAQNITEVMLLANFLAEAGHGEFPFEALESADRAMAAVFAAGRDSGSYVLDADALENFAAIVSLYGSCLFTITNCNALRWVR